MHATLYTYLPIAIDCGCPYNPRPHSSVNVESTTLGSKATYTCDHGYNLVGTATVKCQYDKKWSDVAPLCERKCLHVCARVVTVCVCVCV